MLKKLLSPKYLARYSTHKLPKMNFGVKQDVSFLEMVNQFYNEASQYTDISQDYL